MKLSTATATAFLSARAGRTAEAAFSPPTCNATFDEVYTQEVESRVVNMHSNKDKFHYMDFTGCGMYLNRQVAEVGNIYSSGVFGNPHSFSKSSQVSGDHVDEMRAKVLEFFTADPEEYEVIFTRSATGALVLIAEAFPFSSNSSFAYTQANHASVLGIRSVAVSKGARMGSVTEEDVNEWIDTGSSTNPVLSSSLVEYSETDKKSFSLFAYPAKENWSGVVYPLEWIKQVQDMSTADNEWLVLLDAAAYVPSHRLNLTEVHPDFVDVSFYKIFGIPTGVGALIMKKSSSEKMRRTYWGGSSIYVGVASQDWKLRYTNHAMWEDGTLPFMEIASLQAGFDMIEYLGGIDSIQEHVDCIGKYLSDRLQSLKHSNGRPIVLLYGNHYNDTFQQSYSTSNFNLLTPSGEYFSYRTAAEVFAKSGFQLRDGCMCNYGSCFASLGLSDKEVMEHAEDLDMVAEGVIWGCSGASVGKDSSYQLFSGGADARHTWEWIEVERNGTVLKLPLGSIRASLGAMSRSIDADSLVDFILANYKDVETDPKPDDFDDVSTQDEENLLSSGIASMMSPLLFVVSAFQVFSYFE